MSHNQSIAGLRKAIKAAGSQTNLARAASCSQQAISDIVTGRRRLTLGIALKVARAVKVSPHTIHPGLPKTPSVSP